MNKDHKKELIQEYQNVLISSPEKGQKEQAIQNFLELHTELFSESLTYKNNFHLHMLISKCSVSDLFSDYAYLSKKSDRWKIVFGELELPDYKFFRKGSNDFTADFNHAVQQIRQWKLRIGERKQEVFDFFRLLLQPENMRDNPIDFEFELVFGRSEDKNKTKERMLLIQSLNKSEGITIKSFDTVINDFSERPEHTKKNVITFNGNTIRYKHLHTKPIWDFGIYNSEQLVVTKEQRDILISWGYDMESWEAGKKLEQTGKVRPKDPLKFLY